MNSNTSTNRPIGVTIIAILIILGGISLLIGGLGFIVLGGIISGISSNSVDIASFITLPLGIIMVIIGITYLAVSYGLLKAKGWARIITIIVTIIGMIIQIVSAIIGGLASASISAIVPNILGIIISGVIIFYLYRPNVKAYFGK